MLQSINSYHQHNMGMVERSSIFVNVVPNRFAGCFNHPQTFFYPNNIDQGTNKLCFSIINVVYKDEKLHKACPTVNSFDESIKCSKESSCNNCMNLNNYSREFTPVASSNMHSNQRHKFTPEEDEQLKKLIEINGAKKWDQIALSMPGRTGRQCRDRYHNYLDPALSNGPWTNEEDDLLEQKVNEIGQHWNKIIKFFQGRSTNNIKNRWYTYICHQKKDQNSESSLQSTDKNCDPCDCKTSKIGIDNNDFCNSVGDKYNNIAKKSELNLLDRSFNPIIELNEKDYEKDPSIINIDKISNFDVVSLKSKDKKKIFFPLICPPEDSLIFPLDINRLCILGQECEN